jgi:prolyl-tRNA synthetase
MRTRLFLRTAEFLWQEGHTAHSTAQEAIAETEKMLDVYADFAENWMAMPVIKGKKSANERFAGALDTMCIEALMQDGKALQAGTSHFLGQNFAKAFDVKFATKEGQQEYVWATSWGVSTRLMGALIMTHSDDKGLRLPPKLAPIHVVIVPIYKGVEQIDGIYQKVKPMIDELKALGYTVKFDDDDTKRSGWKFAEYELKGVPVRIAVGQRDLENGTLEVARRDNGEKTSIAIEGSAQYIHNLLNEIQVTMLAESKKFRNEHITEVNSYEEFKEVLETKGGFISAHWDGTGETEERVKNETKATIRCIPLDQKLEDGVCMVTGKPSTGRVLYAKAY